VGKEGPVFTGFPCSYINTNQLNNLKAAKPWRLFLMIYVKLFE